MSCLPGSLHYDADGAAFGIRVLDGHRNPLAFFVNAKDHKLARLLFTSDARSFQNEPFDTRGDELCVDDFEHERSSQRMVF